MQRYRQAATTSAATDSKTVTGDRSCSSHHGWQGGLAAAAIIRTLQGIGIVQRFFSANHGISELQAGARLQPESGRKSAGGPVNG
jgi:hypothetical protein